MFSATKNKEGVNKREFFLLRIALFAKSRCESLLFPFTPVYADSVVNNKQAQRRYCCLLQSFSLPFDSILDTL